MPEYGYRPRVSRWLDKWGFTDDPFAVYEADQERATLPDLFIDRPYVTRIVGDPARPQSAFLLARRGAGKTATREIVVYECTHGRFSRRALPVRYCDFSFLLNQVADKPADITARHHVHAITRATLQTLVDDAPALFFDLLTSSERALLLSLASEFASPVTQLKLGQIIAGAPADLVWGKLSDVEIMETLAGLVLKLGQSEQDRYKSLYILIDRVDETMHGSAAVVSLLKPLVDESRLLSMAGVAFKLFISIEAGEQLLADSAVRSDRYAVQTITWDAAALQGLLDRRLKHYSSNRVEHFVELCATPARASALERLLARSEGSPRTLLRLCSTLVRCHIDRTEDTLIDARDVSQALEEFDQKAEVEQLWATRASVGVDTATPPQSPTLQGLFLDDGGHVWVDAQPVTLPLTHLEFRLLQALYRVAPEIVSQDELITQIWKTPSWTPTWDAQESLRAADEQSLRKLIARLRQRLEPDVTDGAWRFVRNARGRGYWLNKL